MSKKTKETKSTSEITDNITEPRIGTFKPKRKFLNFITGLKGRVRILKDTAYIKGEELSGMLEGIKFKVSILDEGTIDFEEVDTQTTDKSMIKRLIDDIDSLDVTGYVEKFVVSGLEFSDEKGDICYLEVEHKKPMEQLKSIFDEKVELSQKGLSLLDVLFNDGIEVTKPKKTKDKKSVITTDNDKPTKVESKSHTEDFVRESVRKMNEEKVFELKSRIEQKQIEIHKLVSSINTSNALLDKFKEELKVLNSRLESFNTIDEPTGYYFFVSEEKKSGIEPDENLVSVIEKISPILKLKSDVVIDILTRGVFTIKIKKATEGEIDKSIIKKVFEIDSLGKFNLVSETEIEYSGDLTWHQIVKKMISLGFEQNPDFDKDCGSNSYNENKTEETI